MATYELNDAQKAQLEPTRDKWLAIGLSTDEANRAEAERGCVMAYEAQSLDPPKMFMWLRSPLEGAIAAAMLESLKTEPSTLPDRVADACENVFRKHNLTGSERDAYRAALREFPNPPARREATKAEQRRKPWNRVQDTVVRHLVPYLLTKKKVKLSKDFEGEISSTILEECYKAVYSKCFKSRWDSITRQKLDEQLSSCCYGQHDANWLSFFSFFRIECNAPEVQNVEGLEIVAQNCGWWWPFRGLAIMTDRPTHVDRDDENRLHSEDRMAIHYPDGFGFYMWHGTRIPERIIMQSEKISAQEIIDEQNVEIRRIMTEKCGIERLLDAAQEVQRDDYGVLYRLDVRDDEAIAMVQVDNSTPEPDGTVKKYVLRVPPNTRSAHDGIAWSFEMNTQEYVPMTQT